MIDQDFEGKSKKFYRDGSDQVEYICYRDPIQAAKLGSIGTDQAIYAIKKLIYTGAFVDDILFVRDSGGHIVWSCVADAHASLTYT